MFKMDYVITLMITIFVVVPYTLSKNNSYSNLFFKKGQKPRFSCTVNQNADYLMRNHMKWERHSNHGQPEALSRLGNIENGLEKNYSVSIQSTKSWVEFHLEFLQELDEDFGFLQCVLYNSFHEILQIQQVGVFVAPPDEKHLEFEKIGANDLIAGQKRLDDSPADKHIAESSVEIHIFLERSEIVNVPVTKANGNPPRITKQLIPFIMNSNTPKILDVHYVAYPPAVVMWYINCSSSNPVKLTKHITSAATRSYLKLKNIHSESSTCIILVRIQNMHGVKESKTVLLDTEDQLKSTIKKDCTYLTNCINGVQVSLQTVPNA